MRVQGSPVLDKMGWEQWRHSNPFTLEFFRVLDERKRKIEQMLGQGSCLNDLSEHGVAVGRCREITDSTEMTFNELMGIEREDKDGSKGNSD